MCHPDNSQPDACQWARQDGGVGVESNISVQLKSQAEQYARLSS